MTGESAVSMQNIDVLFGANARHASALALLDSGKTREEILESTGVVLGVADASLEVPVGSISVLMGLSGSGKSSLLRCVNGLNTVTRGVLNVRTPDGVINVAACKGAALRKLRRNNLAMVFQQFALLPWASVRENIGFGLSVRGESDAVIRRNVDQQLELVGLEAWADKAIHTLSGGMQQRVGLARAFATDADILLMDEPFSALDPLIREHLQDELLTLQDRLKKTILFVSHDLDEALKLGNQISIMDGGRIVQTGTSDNIVFSPENDYVRRFVANINPLSVLTAGIVMQSLDHTQSLVTHASSGTSVTLNAGKPVAVTSGGQHAELATLRTVEDAMQVLPAASSSSQRLACVSQNMPIKAVLSAASQCSGPTIVVDASGRLCGIIESQDIYAALGHGV